MERAERGDGERSVGRGGPLAFIFMFSSLLFPFLFYRNVVFRSDWNEGGGVARAH